MVTKLSKAHRNTYSDEDANQCEECVAAASLPFHGIYNFSCLCCCARLVVSARPERNQQEAMFASIAKCEIAPKREEIIDYMKNNF